MRCEQALTITAEFRFSLHMQTARTPPYAHFLLVLLITLVLKQQGWRGGAMVGRRTCDQEVASSIPGRARLRNDSGQVVHTQLPRR